MAYSASSTGTAPTNSIPEATSSEMSRRSKYIKRILWGILLTPFILILLVAVLLYVPPVQRFVVQRTAAYLSEKTGMQVSVGNIHLAFPLDLSLQKLQVLRSPGDTPHPRSGHSASPLPYAPSSTAKSRSLVLPSTA